MSHDPHEAGPRYHPDQILFDDCGECADRAASGDHGIRNLDRQRFAAAWVRAAEWQRDRLTTPLSFAELPLLTALWAVQCQLEPLGFSIGEVPVSIAAALLKASHR